MRYAGTRRSEHNPLRSVPTMRTASLLMGPSEADRLVGELRNLLWSASGYVAAYDKARTGLGKANGHNKAWRRASQRDALVVLNVARGAMRSNARRIATLQAKLLSLSIPADLWADAALAGAVR